MSEFTAGIVYYLSESAHCSFAAKSGISSTHSAQAYRWYSRGRNSSSSWSDEYIQSIRPLAGKMEPGRTLGEMHEGTQTSVAPSVVNSAFGIACRWRGN